MASLFWLLARQVQHGVDRETVYLGGSWDADCQSQHHPVVAAGGGHPLGRRGYRVAEPTQTVDILASLVQQRVVDDQIQQSSGIELDNHGHGNLMGQVSHHPSRAAEEVVKAVERMPLLARDRHIGLDRLKHSVLRSLAQAHHPTKQHLDVGLKRWLGKHGQQALQNRVERGYARKHGWGPPCPLRCSMQSLQGTPSTF